MFALIGAIVIAVAALWFLFSAIERALFVDEFEFSMIKEPAGFRRISSGEFSAGRDPFAGIIGADHQGASGANALHGRSLCRALFGAAPIPDGVVPIAYFTDYRCPYCRVLSRRLGEIEEDLADSVHVAWHEWPVFGETSELAAKAAVAAGRQGAYAAFHKRLMETSFVPTPGYLSAISERIGIDADRLLKDMESATVAAQLEETRSLAELFGFPGTPGLIVGRTMVVGAIGDTQLRALISREAADGPIASCRSESGVSDQFSCGSRGLG